MGPRLKNPDFFQELDLDYPGLSEVKQAVDQGDWIGAQKALAIHFKTREEPKWFSEEIELDVWGKFDLQEANATCANTLTSCDIPHDFGNFIDWELNWPYSKKWTWRLSRHLYWVQLSRAYQKTQDEKYTEAFVRQVNHWCQNVLCPIDTHGAVWVEDARMGTDRTNCWRTLECAYRIC